MKAYERQAPLLGVEVTPLDLQELLSVFSSAVQEGTQLTVLGHNLHSVHLYHTQPAFRDCYDQAEIKLADGMPVLASLALQDLAMGKRPPGVSRRLGSTDWIGACAVLSCIRRIVLLGAAESSNSKAAEALAAQAPDAQIMGIPADPWQEDQLGSLTGKIREFDPQLLLIGMGMPLQERVAMQLRESTRVPIIAAVGGALDQLSGAQSLAPRWVGRIGVEWLWRLAADPRRLAGRYLVEPFRLAAVLVRRAG